MYPTAASDTTYRRLFSTGDGADDYIEFVVEKLAGGNWAGHVYVAKDGTDYHKYTNNNYAHNATYHVVATYNASGPTVAIWLNGVAVASTAGSAGSAGYTGTAIGRLYGTAARFYTGKADDVVVYDRVLTDEEIEGHYQSSIIGSTVIATLDIETLLDRSKALSTSTTIDAPVLDAEPNATTADAVTTTWSDPAAYTDPQPLGYEIEMTMADGTIITKVVGTRNYCYWGRLAVGNYSWRVRSIDPWGSVSAYSSADAFTITLSGSAPVVELDPIPSTIWDQPRTSWTYTDADGDVQTNFQVQLDDASNFSSPTTYSGTTALYYQHSGIANGKWYRRVRISTDGGSNWSAWDDDSFTLASPTSQSDSFDIYLDALGTPAELNLTTNPVSGLTITQRLDGPCEFSFAVNNWSGVSISKGEYIQLLVKDADGNRLEFMGEVQSLRRGRMLEVTCRDIASEFDLWPCEWSWSKTTLSNVIRHLVENPTGRADTGITAHIEDTTWTDPVSGETTPITLQDWSGQGKSVGTILEEFRAATGCRWYLESRNKAYHFWWWNPANAPDWAKTIKDNIDYSAESSSQLRLDDGDAYPIAQAEDGPVRNRVRYYARAAAPKMLPGWNTWDDWATEDLDYWRNYGAGVTQATSATVAPGDGSASILFSYTYTAPGSGAIVVPTFVDLGFLVVPRQFADMSSIYWGFLTADVKKLVTTNQGIAAAKIPKSDIELQMILHSGANIGPGTSTAFVMKPSLNLSTSFTNTKWQIYDNADSLYNDQGDLLFDLTNVTAIQLRAVCRDPKSPTALTAGKSWALAVYLDHLAPIGASGEGGPATGQHYIETAAVTAGTDVPVEAKLDDMGMNLEDASAWAALYLAQLQADVESISDVAVVGVQNIPLRKNIPLYLAEHLAIDASYPLAEVRWEPQVGQTTLKLGSIPADDLRRDEQIKRHINRLGAAVRSR